MTIGSYASDYNQGQILKGVVSGEIPINVSSATLSAGTLGSGSVEREVAEKLGEIVSVKDFGAKGDGVTDDTQAFALWVAALQKTIAGRGRAALGFLPRGKYSLSAELEFPLLDAGSNNGRTIIAGCGEANTELHFTHTGGNNIRVKGGQMRFRDFLMTNSAGRIAGTYSGEDVGHGFLCDPDTGVYETTAVYDFEHVVVADAPKDAFHMRGPERAVFNNCTAYAARRHGFFLNGQDPSIVQGISSCGIASRAILCGGNGWRVYNSINHTFIACQALTCGSVTYPAGVYLDGLGCRWINGDIEGHSRYDDATNGVGNGGTPWVLYGLHMGSFCTCEGGFFGSLHYGIFLNGSGRGSVIRPMFSNYGKATMSRAIQCAGIVHGMHFDLNEVFAYPNVAFLTDPAYYASNDFYVNGVKQYICTAADLASAAHLVNTTAHKRIGSQQMTTDGQKMYFCIGTGATGKWRPYADDSGAGDITPA